MEPAGAPCDDLAREENVASDDCVHVESIQKHLSESRCALNVLRRRVRCCWVAAALAIGIGSKVVVFCLTEQVKDSFVDIFFLCFLAVFRLSLVSLAPVIDDLPMCRAMVVSDMLMTLFDWSALRCIDILENHTSVSDALMQDWLGNLQCLLFTTSGFWALVSRSISDAQVRMWRGLGLYGAVALVQFGQISIQVAHREHELSPALGGLPAFSLLVFLALSPGLRRRIQRQVRKRLEGRAGIHGAASLACLVGSASPQEAVKMARQRFRCIENSQLSLDMLRDNTPDPLHNELAQHCALGSCDAFISHSWHDCAEAKWRCLQEWSAAFVDRKASDREPLLWFDRCCISQSQIDMDLRCLPIFLKGCKRLVVLCGPTYLSRLWCILEIFVHIHMGGSIDDVELVEVYRMGHELEDAKAIEESFDHFDVRNCQCYDPDDKRQIIAMIEIAFGSLYAFNCVVSGMIGRVKSKLSVPSPGALSCGPLESADAAV